MWVLPNARAPECIIQGPNTSAKRLQAINPGSLNRTPVNYIFNSVPDSGLSAVHSRPSVAREWPEFLPRSGAAIRLARIPIPLPVLPAHCGQTAASETRDRPPRFPKGCQSASRQGGRVLGLWGCQGACVSGCYGIRLG